MGVVVCQRLPDQGAEPATMLLEDHRVQTDLPLPRWLHSIHNHTQEKNGYPEEEYPKWFRHPPA
jgi:hypothetical protein